jgi:hypothetical protein
MKLITSFTRCRTPLFTTPTWYIFPFIVVSWSDNTFLETGVYTKALNIEFGWFKAKWTFTIQEAY